jgi:hypothetical protein
LTRSGHHAPDRRRCLGRTGRAPRAVDALPDSGRTATIVLGIGPAIEASLAERASPLLANSPRPRRPHFGHDAGNTRARYRPRPCRAGHAQLVQAPTIPDVAVPIAHWPICSRKDLAVQVSTSTANQVIASIDAIVGVTTEPLPARPGRAIAGPGAARRSALRWPLRG